jgi:hypothetical protein
MVKKTGLVPVGIRDSKTEEWENEQVRLLIGRGSMKEQEKCMWWFLGGEVVR